MRQHIFHRRQFLGITGGVSAVLLVDSRGAATVASERTTAIERKDVRDLTDDEIDLYREAMKRLQSRSQSDKTSFHYQASIHRHHCPHGNWWFLPWHRAYLFYFEQLLRDAVQDLNPPKLPSIPYWDWTDERQIPPAFRGTFPSNPLANNTRYGRTLQEYYVGSTRMRSVVDDKNTFISFGSSRARSKRQNTGKAQFEYQPHDHVHVRVGNDMDDPPTAAFDPIFWSHHAKIDRWWNYWLSLPGHENPREDNSWDRPWYEMRLDEFVDTNGNNVSRTIKEIMEDVLIQSVVYVPYSGRSPRRVVALANEEKGTSNRQEAEPVEIQGTLAADQNSLLKLGQPLTVTITVNEIVGQRIQALFGAKEVRGSVLLIVNGLEFPEKPQPAEIRVFLNHPQVDKANSRDVPQFVDAIPVFDFGGDHQHNEADRPDDAHAGTSRLVDVTKTVRQQLAAKTYGLSEPLKVTLVLTARNAADGQRDPLAENLQVPFRDVRLLVED